MRLTPTNTVSDNSLRSENDSSQPDFGSSPGARTNYHQLHPSSQGILLLLSHLRSSRFHTAACTNPRFSGLCSHAHGSEPQAGQSRPPSPLASTSSCVLRRCSAGGSPLCRCGRGRQTPPPATHLPCQSNRTTPSSGRGACSSRQRMSAPSRC